MSRSGGYFDFAEKEKEIKNLKSEIAVPRFWDDQNKAKQITQKLADLEREAEEWNDFKKETNDLLELSELAEKDADSDLEKDIELKLSSLEKKYEELEFFVLFNGKYDKNNAIISIHAGTGGVDAQDWAEMLLRMILRFCENKNLKTNIISQVMGSEAGIKNVTLEILGRYAYGWLKSEAGVHRLVRISPFDAEKMRHTSFSLIEVIPELPENNSIEIAQEDLRIDTFMSSGHGGQSVNTTYSAVRIVHLPTNITVTCQNERSQLQNKETALKILRSKLNQLQVEQRAKEVKDVKGDYMKAQWGNQIRSYVLHPYKMVKDHRTKFVFKEPYKVLDGNLDEFVKEYLKMEV
ncbi:peptide chain release factor 2 [Patescibacteria group bacterium]